MISFTLRKIFETVAKATNPYAAATNQKERFLPKGQFSAREGELKLAQLNHVTRTRALNRLQLKRIHATDKKRCSRFSLDSGRARLDTVCCCEETTDGCQGDLRFTNLLRNKPFSQNKPFSE